MHGINYPCIMIRIAIAIQIAYIKEAAVPINANAISRGRLKTRHIVLLVHLDEQRSVLRAARAANMTQPGASKLLSDLEESLGVQLFVRHARGVEPTWFGEIMMRRARGALAEMDRAQDEIAALLSGLTGRCSIGAVVNPATNLVPTAVALLKQQHPRVLVGIEIDNSAALATRLLTGELDIVVARIPSFAGADALRFEALAGETHRVFARAEHPLAGRRRLDLSDLVDQAWVLPPSGSLLRNRVDSMFVHRGLGLPLDVVETASIPVITSLLQTTDMVSPLQEETVASYVKSGLLVVLPLTLGVQMEPFGIVTRREHKMSPSAQALLESLHLAAARIYGNRKATTSSDTKPKAAKRPATDPIVAAPLKRRVKTNLT
jgi:DNA-binding transcriptional LysR family regulator